MQKKTRDLLLKYDRPVPRYTSYPTAPHFKDAPAQGDLKAQLRAIPEEKSVSLYIHIPFCRHLCSYCGCHTRVVNEESPISAYLEAVRCEIKLAAAAIGRRQKVSHIHFGGGTPNFAPTKDLEALLSLIANEFMLAVSPVIAMEMDPRILHKDKVRSLAKLGVNRASLGVQDFHADVQQAINRVQPCEFVQQCVGWLREAGVKSVNFDMIYGLPLQTTAKIRANMEKLKTLRPERIALFGYAHVPWFKAHQKKLEAFPLPGAPERLEMAEAARSDLITQGYVPVGIDHFALPEDDLAVALKERRLRRNFQGYTADTEEYLLGFGQTAISDYGDAYVQNTALSRDYRETVESGALPAVKACLLSAGDVYRRAVIGEVMCYGTADLAALADGARWAAKTWAQAEPALKTYASDGLVTLNGKTVAITETGRPLTRLIASAFDAYLRTDDAAPAPRHAQAV
ncbi:MAG: oxygen-independent coproporphyrinogen III oxidase [Alphaproteobacteria bacterium]|nr:oxygen-independent coproporphyrinogen III oxidase [Alphaproteobacteria bacterium]